MSPALLMVQWGHAWGGHTFCDFSVKHTLRVLIFLRFVRGNGTGSTDSNVRSAYSNICEY